MHFIICLSATINTIPEKVEKHIYSADNEPSGVAASNVKGNYKGGGKVDVFCNFSSIVFFTFNNCICIKLSYFKKYSD